jgi:hypothetical protein
MSDICDVFCINKEAVEVVRAKMLEHNLVADTAEIFKVLVPNASCACATSLQCLA